MPGFLTSSAKIHCSAVDVVSVPPLRNSEVGAQRDHLVVRQLAAVVFVEPDVKQRVNVRVRQRCLCRFVFYRIAISGGSHSRVFILALPTRVDQRHVHVLEPLPHRDHGLKAAAEEQPRDGRQEGEDPHLGRRV